MHALVSRSSAREQRLQRISPFQSSPHFSTFLSSSLFYFIFPHFSSAFFFLHFSSHTSRTYATRSYDHACTREGYKIFTSCAIAFPARADGIWGRLRFDDAREPAKLREASVSFPARRAGSDTTRSAPPAEKKPPRTQQTLVITSTRLVRPYDVRIVYFNLLPLAWLKEIAGTSTCTCTFLARDRYVCFSGRVSRHFERHARFSSIFSFSCAIRTLCTCGEIRARTFQLDVPRFVSFRFESSRCGKCKN